jgi:hypothetical protein
MRLRHRCNRGEARGIAIAFQQKHGTIQPTEEFGMRDDCMDTSSDGKVELIADYACDTGENPLWHATEAKLYWCDILRGRIFRFDPATMTHEQYYEGRPAGGFTMQCDGALLLFMDCGTIATGGKGNLRRSSRASRKSWIHGSMTSSPIRVGAFTVAPCRPNKEGQALSP